MALHPDLLGTTASRRWGAVTDLHHRASRITAARASEGEPGGASAGGFQDAQAPWDFAILLPLHRFVRDPLEQKTQVRRVHFQLLVGPIAKYLAVAERVRPARSRFANIDPAGKQ